jgi:hypothetical protein
VSERAQANALLGSGLLKALIRDYQSDRYDSWLREDDPEARDKIWSRAVASEELRNYIETRCKAIIRSN